MRPRPRDAHRRGRRVARNRGLLAGSSLAGFIAALAAGAVSASPPRAATPSSTLPPTTSPSGTSTSTTPPSSTSPSTTAPSSTASPSTTTTTTTPPATRSAVGSTEQYGYGSIAADVTVQGSRIVAVTVSSLSTAESYSQSLAEQAIPVLKQEVLAAQSTQVNGVTGATYTSQAYLASIQSALDTLGP